MPFTENFKKIEFFDKVTRMPNVQFRFVMN